MLLRRKPAVDDEKRQANVAWAEVRGSGDDRNVLTGSVQKSLKCGVRLLLRRGGAAAACRDDASDKTECRSETHWASLATTYC